MAGSDFPPREFIGGEILSYFGYILIIVQQGEPWKSLPPSQADGCRARSLRGEGARSVTPKSSVLKMKNFRNGDVNAKLGHCLKTSKCRHGPQLPSCSSLRPRPPGTSQSASRPQDAATARVSPSHPPSSCISSIRRPLWGQRRVRYCSSVREPDGVRLGRHFTLGGVDSP